MRFGVLNQTAQDDPRVAVTPNRTVNIAPIRASGLSQSTVSNGVHK
jgi:hypothetical protein